MSQFASAEADRDFDFIAFVEEFLHMLGFRVKVARADFRLHTDFLELQYLLVFLGVSELFFHFKPVFAEVEYFADRRIRVWRNFNKVEVLIPSHSERINRRYDSFLITLIIY